MPALDRIEPGQHENSFLWRKLNGTQGGNGGSRMPLGGPFLTLVQLRRIALYIDGL